MLFITDGVCVFQCYFCIILVSFSVFILILVTILVVNFCHFLLLFFICVPAAQKQS